MCVLLTRAALHTLLGLNYAEEIGEEGDPNPRYYCHVCKTHMDYNNTALHFTSTAHRHIVLVSEREREREELSHFCLHISALA